MSRDIICTVPATLDRTLLMRQLDGSNGVIAWHLCVNRLPRRQPDRLHFVHRGEVIGSLPVLDMIDWDGRTLLRPDGTLLPTGDRRYAVRASGVFRPQSPPLRMRGFQGWRYFTGHADECHVCSGLEVIIDTAGDAHPCPACGQSVIA